MGRKLGYDTALGYGVAIAIALTLLSILPGIVVLLGLVLVNDPGGSAMLAIRTLGIGSFFSLAVGLGILYKLVVDGVVEGLATYDESGSITEGNP